MERAAVGTGLQAMQALRNAGLLRTRGGFVPSKLAGTHRGRPSSWSLVPAARGLSNCSDDGTASSRWRIDILRLHPAPAIGLAASSTMHSSTVGCAFVLPGTTAWVRVLAADLAPLAPATASLCEIAAVLDATSATSKQARNKTLYWAASGAAAIAATPRWQCAAYLQLAVPARMLAASGDPLDATSTLQTGEAIAMGGASQRLTDGLVRSGELSSPAAAAAVVRAAIGPVARLPWGALEAEAEPFLSAMSTSGGKSQETAVAVEVAGAASLRWRPAQGTGAVMAAASVAGTSSHDAVSFGSWPRDHCQSPTAGWIPAVPSSPAGGQVSLCLPGHAPLAGSTWPPLQSSHALQSGLFAHTASIAGVPASGAGVSVSSLDSSLLLVSPGSHSSVAMSWSPGSLPSVRGRVVTSVGATFERAGSGTSIVLLGRWPVPAGAPTSSIPVLSAYHAGERSSNCTVVVVIRVSLPDAAKGETRAFELRLAEDWARGSASRVVARVWLANQYDSLLDVGALSAALPASGDDGRGGTRKVSILRLRRSTSTGSFAVGDSEHETDAIGVLDGCETAPPALFVRGSGLPITLVCGFNTSGVTTDRSAAFSVQSEVESGAAVLEFVPQGAHDALRVAPADSAILTDPGGMATLVPAVKPGAVVQLVLRPSTSSAGMARTLELVVEASVLTPSDTCPGWRCRVSVIVLPPAPRLAKWSGGGSMLVGPDLRTPHVPANETAHGRVLQFSMLHAGICSPAGNVAQGQAAPDSRSAIRCANSGLCDGRFYVCTDGVPSAILDAASAGLVCRNDSLVAAGSLDASDGVNSNQRECRAPIRPTLGAALGTSESARREFCRAFPSGRYCTDHCSVFRVVCGTGDGTLAPALQSAPVGQSCLGGEWVSSAVAPCSRVRDPGCEGSPLSGTELRCAAFAEGETDDVAAPVPGSESTGMCSPLVFVCDGGKRLQVTPAPPGTKCASSSRIPSGATLLELEFPALGALPEATSTRLLLSLSPGAIMPADDTLCQQSMVADFANMALLSCPTSLDEPPAAFTQLAALGPLVSSSVTGASSEPIKLAAIGQSLAPLLHAAFGMTAGLRRQMHEDLGLPAASERSSAADMPQLWRCVGFASRLCTAEASSCASRQGTKVQISSEPSPPMRGPAGTACFGGELVPWDYDVCSSLADPATGTVVDRFDPAAATTVSRKFVVLGLALEGVPAAAAASIGVQLAVRRAFGSLYTRLLTATTLKLAGNGQGQVLVVGEQLVMLRDFDIGAAELQAANECPTANRSSAVVASQLSSDQLREAIPFRSLSAVPHTPWAVPLAPEQGTASPAELGPEAWKSAPAGAGPAGIQVFLGADSSTAADELATAVGADLMNGKLQRRLQASAGLGPQLQRLHMWAGTGCEAVDALDPSIPHSGNFPGGSLSLDGTLVLIDNPRHAAMAFGGLFAWWFDIPEWGQITIIVVAALLFVAICGALATCRRCCGIRCDNTPRRHGRRRAGDKRHGVIRARATSDEDFDGHGVPSGIRAGINPAPAVRAQPLASQRGSDSSDSRRGNTARASSDALVPASVTGPDYGRSNGTTSPRPSHEPCLQGRSDSKSVNHRSAEWGAGRGQSAGRMALPGATPPVHRVARNPSYPSRRRVPMNPQRVASQRHMQAIVPRQPHRQVVVRPHDTFLAPRVLAAPRMQPASWHPGSTATQGAVVRAASPTRRNSQSTLADDPRAPSPS